MGNNCPQSARILSLLLLAGGLAACTAVSISPSSATPQYEISVPGAEDSLTMTVANGATFADIHSTRGIGEASVALVAGEWPAGLTLRFYLDGLESLQLAYGDTKIALSLTTSGPVLQSASTADGGEIATTEESPYHLAVSYVDAEGQPVADKVTGGAILVAMPADFFASDAQAFDLSWIDFYR